MYVDPEMVKKIQQQLRLMQECMPPETFIPLKTINQLIQTMEPFSHFMETVQFPVSQIQKMERHLNQLMRSMEPTLRYINTLQQPLSQIQEIVKLQATVMKQIEPLILPLQQQCQKVVEPTREIQGIQQHYFQIAGQTQILLTIFLQHYKIVKNVKREERLLKEYLKIMPAVQPAVESVKKEVKKIYHLKSLSQEERETVNNINAWIEKVGKIILEQSKKLTREKIEKNVFTKIKSNTDIINTILLLIQILLLIAAL